jgi:hypothetical protein
MPISRSALLVFIAFGLLLLGGCAALQLREPIDVNLAGVEPLQGEITLPAELFENGR